MNMKNNQYEYINNLRYDKINDIVIVDDFIGTLDEYFIYCENQDFDDKQRPLFGYLYEIKSRQGFTNTVIYHN